jgi:hypothetical protein
MPSVSLGSTSYNVTIGYSPSLSVVQQAQGIEGPAGDSYWVDANPGIYTTANIAIGTDIVSTGSTALWVQGDVRITGILSVGQGTVTIDGNTNTVNVDNIIVGTTLTGPSGVGYATEGYVDNLVAISTFSGDYNDLSNQPSIPSIVGLASEGYVDTSIANLVDSAPETLDTLNELASALGDDPNFSTTILNSLGNKADLSGANFTGVVTATSFVGDGSNLTGISTFSGDYNDLINTPTTLSSFSNDVGFVTSSIVVGLASEGYVNNLVAISTFSGDYNDLSNQPSIPSDTGDLTNSVGFVTSSIVVGYATEGYVDNLVAISTFSGDYNDLSNQPSIPSIVGLASEGYVDNLVAISTFSGNYNDLSNTPTTLSSFSNDVGFVTSSIVVGYATEGYVTQQIANLVDGAPEALDTLNELAAALNDDENFATTVTNSLALKANIDNASFTGITTTQTLNVGVGGTIITTTGIGSVGIGSTQPTATLDVNGSIISQSGGIVSKQGTTSIPVYLNSYASGLQPWDSYYGLGPSNAWIFNQLILRSPDSAWSIANGQRRNVNTLGSHHILFGAVTNTNGSTTSSSTKTFGIQPLDIDSATVDLYLRGAAANPTATTNITGGHTFVVGGAGASSSSGNADGGNLYLNGGTGYGTGSNGNVLIGTVQTSNVGIGSTQPTATLDVVGDVNITGIVTATSYTGSGVNLSGIVTSIVAGTNITISGSSGEVTINSSGGGGESISPFLLMGA